MSRKMTIVAVVLVTALAIPMAGLAQPGPNPGQPFAYLQNQINALQSQIGGLSGGLAVFDSLGNKVGDLLDKKIAVFEYEGEFYAFPIFRNDYERRAPQGVLWFGTPDCSGQAYMWDPEIQYEPYPPYHPLLSVLRYAMVTVPGNTLYVESGPPQYVEPFIVPPFTGPKLAYLDQSSVCNHGIVSGRLIPVEPLIDLGTLFTPPFHVSK